MVLCGGKLPRHVVKNTALSSAQVDLPIMPTTSIDLQRQRTSSLTSPVVVRVDVQVQKKGNWKKATIRAFRKLSFTSLHHMPKKFVKGKEINEALSCLENSSTEKTSLAACEVDMTTNCQPGSPRQGNSDSRQIHSRRENEMLSNPKERSTASSAEVLLQSKDLSVRKTVDEGNISSLQNREKEVAQLSSTSSARHHTNGQSSVHDSYLILETLGEGSYATVFRAVAKHNKDSHVALKRFDLGSISCPERREKVERMVHNECSLLNRVKKHHSGNASNVVEIFGVHHEPGTEHVYLAMEYMQGGELHDRINATMKFDEEEAKRVFQEIACGVAQMHACGIVHRDLKPENIIYEHTGSESMVKIADFGAAFVEGESDTDVHKGIRIGSPGYFAPEVYRLNYSTAGDIWSLGVVLYCLLSGKHPFPGDTEVAVMMKVVMASYTFDDPCWESVSDEAKDLIKQMLLKIPSDRLTIEQVLAHPWIASYKTVGRGPSQVRLQGSQHHACQEQNEPASEENSPPRFKIELDSPQKPTKKSGSRLNRFQSSATTVSLSSQPNSPRKQPDTAEFSEDTRDDDRIEKDVNNHESENLVPKYPRKAVSDVMKLAARSVRKMTHNKQSP